MPLQDFQVKTRHTRHARLARACGALLLKVAFVVDSRLRCCVVEKSFFRNIRRFEPHHSALAEVFGFLVFMFNVLKVRDGGGR